MVTDERANRFIDTFVEQWLDIDAMNRVEVDTKVYPAFGRNKRIDHLRELIRREPVEFFGRNPPAKPQCGELHPLRLCDAQRCACASLSF